MCCISCIEKISQVSVASKRRCSDPWAQFKRLFQHRRRDSWTWWAVHCSEFPEASWGRSWSRTQGSEEVAAAVACHWLARKPRCRTEVSLWGLQPGWHRCSFLVRSSGRSGWTRTRCSAVAPFLPSGRSRGFARLPPRVIRSPARANCTFLAASARRTPRPVEAAVSDPLRPCRRLPSKTTASCCAVPSLNLHTIGRSALS